MMSTDSSQRCPGGVELEPEPLELVVLVPAAKPDVDAAAGQQVERGDLFGDDERMVQRHDDDRRADAQRVVFAAIYVASWTGRAR